MVELKRRYFTFSAGRLKELFDLPLSCGAMYRIWREHGLIKKKKKYQRQRDLREVKRGYKVLEKLVVDTKRLDDIVELYPVYYRYRLPWYEFSARDIRTGGVWIFYVCERSLTNAVIFLKLLGRHLLSCGVDLKKVVIHTDNGGEFVGSSKKKEPSEFVRLVEQNWGGHFPIPPGAKTYLLMHTHNSDVEAFHRRIEEEFYRIEPINSYLEFFGKAKTYIPSPVRLCF